MGARDLFPVMVLITGFLLATSSWAGDGVLEINQTCAKETGCFPGDTPGYPVTITGAAGRSYRLTSDLGVSGQNTTAIAIGARDTTIDLAGFRITCTSFTPPSTLQPCSEAGPGTGSGISVDDSATVDVEVRNGSVFGMPGNGVSLGRRCVVRALRVSENGADGIQGDQACAVVGNTVSESGGYGISVGRGSTASGNTVSQNGDGGIRVGRGSTASGNTILENGGNGILTGNGATVSGNTISTSESSLGMLLNSNTGYRDNVINGDRTGAGGAGVNLGGNLCNGVLCP